MKIFGFPSRYNKNQGHGYTSAVFHMDGLDAPNVPLKLKTAKAEMRKGVIFI
jgi:hypothetical protein